MTNDFKPRVKDHCGLRNLITRCADLVAGWRIQQIGKFWRDEFTDWRLANPLTHFGWDFVEHFVKALTDAGGNLCQLIQWFIHEVADLRVPPGIVDTRRDGRSPEQRCWPHPTVRTHRRTHLWCIFIHCAVNAGGRWILLDTTALMMLAIVLKICKL